MPYRRLPNTDQARLRAMETCLEKGKIKSMYQLAFSQQSLERLQTFHLKFLSATKQLQVSRETQFNRAKEYADVVRKAKLYVSHFLQVLNFGIMRDEIKPEVREYYGMDKDTKSVPALNLDSQVLEWGERVITGEQKRMSKGGNPIYNPSIALVKVHYEEFKDAYHYQKMLQNITTRASNLVAELRSEADELIQLIWDEIEEKFADYPDDVKRESAAEYGIVYVYRNSELTRMQLERMQPKIIFS